MSSKNTSLPILNTPNVPSTKPLKRRYVLEVEIPTRRSTIKAKTETSPTDSSTSDDNTGAILQPTKRMRISTSDKASSVTSPSVASSDSKRLAKRIGKTRAIIRLSSRSRSRSHSSTYTRPSVPRALSIYNSKRGTSAGPSGVQDEVHGDDAMAVLEEIRSQIGEDEARAIELGLGVDGRPANLDILAVAAEFLNDENGALEMFPDGRAALVPAMAEMPKIKEEVVELRKAYEVEEVVTDGSGEAVEVPECAICMEEISGVIADAEKGGKGGVDGGLAMWACDLPNCGALYCITCALEWANQAFGRNAHPACPKCTRPTQVLALRKQAFAYDQTIRYPFKAMPLLRPDAWKTIVPLMVYYRQTDQGRIAGDDSRAFADWYRLRAFETYTPERREANAIVMDGYMELAELSWSRFINARPTQPLAVAAPGRPRPVPGAPILPIAPNAHAAPFIAAMQAVRHVQGVIPQAPMNPQQEVEQILRRFREDRVDQHGRDAIRDVLRRRPDLVRGLIARIEGGAAGGAAPVVPAPGGLGRRRNPGRAGRAVDGPEVVLERLRVEALEARARGMAARHAPIQGPPQRIALPVPNQRQRQPPPVLPRGVAREDLQALLNRVRQNINQVLQVPNAPDADRAFYRRAEEDLEAINAQLQPGPVGRDEALAWQVRRPMDGAEHRRLQHVREVMRRADEPRLGAGGAGQPRAARVRFAGVGRDNEDRDQVEEDLAEVPGAPRMAPGRLAPARRGRR